MFLSDQMQYWIKIHLLFSYLSLYGKFSVEPKQAPVQLPEQIIALLLFSHSPSYTCSRSKKKVLWDMYDSVILLFQDRSKVSYKY